MVDEIPGAFDARTTADPNRILIALDDGTLDSYDRTTGAPVGPVVEPDFEIFDGLVTSDQVLVWPFNGPMSAIDPRQRHSHSRRRSGRRGVPGRFQWAGPSLHGGG